MTEPIPNKDEQDVLNQLGLLLRIHAATQANFGLNETRLRALARDPVKNPLAQTLLEELVKARFVMGAYGGATVGTA